MCTCNICNKCVVKAHDDFLNTKKPHKHADVIKAWADGAEIEVWQPLSKKWVDATCNDWSTKCDYRVKSIDSFSDVAHLYSSQHPWEAVIKAVIAAYKEQDK